MYEGESIDILLEQRIKKRKKRQKVTKAIKRIIRLIIVVFLIKEGIDYAPIQYEKYKAYKQFKQEIQTNYIKNPETINRGTYKIDIQTARTQIKGNLTALNNAGAIGTVNYNCIKNNNKIICKLEEDTMYNIAEDGLIKR